MEDSGVLGVTEPTSAQTTSALRHLIDETADLIESPTFARVLTLLNNESFETLIRQCTADAFKTSAFETDPRSFTSVATVVPTAEPRTKLANVLAVMARQAHVIGNGTNPPNIYLSAMDQGVRELEAFAAVVYSSNFDQELLGSASKAESLGAEPADGSDSASYVAPVLVDREEAEAAEEDGYHHISTGGDSAFEQAWGKAVHEPLPEGSAA